jgi:endoglucanase
MTQMPVHRWGSTRSAVCRIAGFSLLALALLNSAFAGEESTRIRLNSIGYLPKAEKKATIAAPCTNFSVELPGGLKVFKATVTGPVVDPETRERLYTADFSAYNEPGEYELVVPGVGRSAPFRIGADIYREPCSTVLLGLYLWRCGTGVSARYNGQTFAHGPCHTNDAWLDLIDGSHAHQDGTGGWHDAGDYNKYVVNAGMTLGALFRAWLDFGPQLRKLEVPIPEAGGKLPAILAESKWELDWLLKMQATNGSVYHKISTKRFGPFVPPEAETEERFFTPWGSEATADFTAVMAQAARIYRPYDSAFAGRCLQAAQASYRFLQDHPGYHAADLSAVRTGSYQVPLPHDFVNGTPHNRLWAAAELWETTGSPEVLFDLEKHIRSIGGHVSADFDWPDAKNLGLMTYVFSERIGRDPATLNLVRSNLLAVADGIVRTARSNGHGRPLGSLYYWGANGGVARQTLLLMAADRLTRNAPAPHEVRGAQLVIQTGGPPTGKPAYRAACLDAINYLLGRNCYGRSFVTGLGFDPPRHPHDRRSGGNQLAHPWPGYLVGGPEIKATDWKDEEKDARTNEIAINWNAALVYALSAFLPE